MDLKREKGVDLIKFNLIQYDEDLIDEHGNYQDAKVEKQADTVQDLKEQGELRAIMNSLLPPVKVGNDKYRQASLNKAIRTDVVALQQSWDDQLQDRQARETGICSIREQLNEEAFNELIRQISINLPERGLLALRMKNEAKMTVQTYQTLYQSSLSFGMRKCIQSQNDISCVNKTIRSLEEKKKALKRKMKEMRIVKQGHEKLSNEQNQILEKNLNQETEFLKHQTTALQGYLKTEFGK